MSRSSAEILRGALLVCCAMLLGSLVILLYVGTPTARTIDLFMLAKELYRVPAGILLSSVIIAAVIEERQEKNK